MQTEPTASGRSGNHLSKSNEKTLNAESSTANTNQTQNFQIAVPQINLPKGGGAIKGIDEKFSVNSANGSLSFGIPLPFSKSRNDFMPQLSISYNSGNGNSILGIGWNLDLPFIQRKTDKQLPQYEDDRESDVFLFSGAEDLVPRLKDDGTVDEKTYSYYIIKRYRPRIEGLFARIERIQDKTTNAIHWKVTTRDNIVTFFGLTEHARISNRANNSEDISQIFKWLPQLSYDNKGNCIVYEYERENEKLIPNSLNESQRLADKNFPNTYLKKVFYCNKKEHPFYIQGTDESYQPPLPVSSRFLLSAAFDFGDFNDIYTTTGSSGIRWECRPDPFSDYRAGFEIRTYRRCKRILFFHHFEELNGKGLVRSLEFEYKGVPANNEDPFAYTEVSHLKSIDQKGYIWDENNSRYVSRSLPKLEFDYHEVNWDNEIKIIEEESLDNLPVGLSGGYQFTDFYNEGISGILTEQSDGWYYKSNLGNGEFTPAQPIIPKPSFAGLSSGVLQLADLEADGTRQVVCQQRGMNGYFELNDENEWIPFKTFVDVPNINWGDPYLKQIDLNGDGKAELLVTEDNVFVWYESLGKIGYAGTKRSFQQFDEAESPHIVFADALQSIFLADMNGDGLTDIVRVRNGEVCYWANMGYGRFSKKVTMSDAPVFDHPDQFNPDYIHLSDISGTGATDILYLGKKKIAAWLNLSGNAWSKPFEIENAPTFEQPNTLSVVDLLGNGTSCLVWSSPLPGNAGRQMRYIDLMGGKKPHILCEYRNNTGKQTKIYYKSSSQYYVEDKRAGKRWKTKLPFPVQCVSKVEVFETHTDSRYANEYSYHHGYYDHEEREFRGFGRVEQIDTDTFKDEISQANDRDNCDQLPVITKAWFHTGVYFGKKKLLDHFKSDEYFQNSEEHHLTDALIEDDLEIEEWSEAARACKGMMLRQEVWTGKITDQSIQPDKIISAAERTCRIKLIQPKGTLRHAIFLVTESENIAYHYEGITDDPRITHQLNVEFDSYGNILLSAAVVYGRKGEKIPTEAQLEIANVAASLNFSTLLLNAQSKRQIVITETAYTNAIDDDRDYRLPLPWLASTYEWNKQLNPSVKFLNRVDLSRAEFENAPIEDFATNVVNNHKKLIERVKTLFYNNALNQPLPEGQLPVHGLVYESYKLAFTKEILEQFAGVASLSFLKGILNQKEQSGYHKFDANSEEYWIPSGRATYDNNASQLFYQPTKFVDPFHRQNTAPTHFTTIRYDNKYLFYIDEAKDARNNTTAVTDFNFRVLAPNDVADENGNHSLFTFDELALPAAIALKGKNGEGDDLSAHNLITEATAVNAILKSSSFDFDEAIRLLGAATQFFVYNFEGIPSACTLSRTIHTSALGGNPLTNDQLQVGIEYSDGLGRLLEMKVRAEPGKYKDPTTGLESDADPRWVGTGRTIFNNKGKPVKQYEPFFSNTHLFQDEDELRQIGYTPKMFYDPLGRLILKLNPDESFSNTEFDSWQQIVWDENDNVVKVPNLVGSGKSWYQMIADDPTSTEQQKAAANRAKAHADTPTVVHSDSLGRAVLSLATNNIDKDGNIAKTIIGTFTELDIEGKPVKISDGRNNTVMVYTYDVAGNVIKQDSMDAGVKYLLNDAAGKPLYSWDAKKNRVRLQYDVLQRPLQQWLLEGGTGNEILLSKTVYGEDKPVPATPVEDNIKGKPWKIYDQAGLTENVIFDFKGNLKKSKRQLNKLIFITDAGGKKRLPYVDYNAATPSLEPEEYTTLTEYDALDRPTKVILPQDSAVIHPFYNEAALLDKLSVTFEGAIKEFVKDIAYNEKGQREKIIYGNDTFTTYKYEEKTFRLMELTTSWKDAPPAGNGNKNNHLQHLFYTYDPVGNITEITDEAQNTCFYQNNIAKPTCKYAYDALYRLIYAEGREGIGNNKPWSQFDEERTGKNHPIDPNALQSYTEKYGYDETNNMRWVTHIPGIAGTANTWTKTFDYNALNNQLIKEVIGNGTNQITNFDYDANGNMEHLGRGTVINPSFEMVWDYANQLQQCENGPNTDVYFVYDGGGQRVRKIYIDNNIVKERIYIGAFELYRERTTIGADSSLERQTIHIMDDKQPIAMIDKLTKGDIHNNIARLIRYQYNNHVGSSCLEILTEKFDNDCKKIITYEEYYPYGCTSWQSFGDDSFKELPKRYRYTGKERDEETGLCYYGARYYASWLCKWVNCDPKGYIAGLNLYSYCSCNPIIKVDKDGLQDSHADETWDAPPPSSEPPSDMKSCLVSQSDVDREQGKLKSYPEMTGMAGNKNMYFGTAMIFTAIIGMAIAPYAVIPAYLSIMQFAGGAGLLALGTAQNMDSNQSVVQQESFEEASNIIPLVASPTGLIFFTATLMATGDVNSAIAYGILGQFFEASGAAASNLKGNKPTGGGSNNSGGGGNNPSGGSPGTPPHGTGNVPPVVESRINIAYGHTPTSPIKTKSSGPLDLPGQTSKEAGLGHIINDHFLFLEGSDPNAGKFSISVEELIEILENPKTIKSPVTLERPDPFGTYTRTVDVGRVVGTVKPSLGGGTTTWLLIRTDRLGNLITAYPVPKPK